MYEIAITTPFGELGTKAFTEDEKNQIEVHLLEKIGTLQYISFVLEDGNTLYLSKEMIGRSVFILRKIS
jgi:hypothetical protein